MKKEKNNLVEFLLCAFLGFLGAHKFYAGKKAMGLIYLCTIGLFGVGWLFDTVSLAIKIFIQASTPKDDTKVAISQPAKSKNDAKEIFGKPYKVTGITHYTDNILAISEKNRAYGMTKREIIGSNMADTRIWKYHFHPKHIEVVPEPDNPYDKNAIKVIVDGEHIGYIKAGSCAHLLKVIRENRLVGIKCEIGGGPYKCVYKDYGEDEAKPEYFMENDEISFFCRLEIKEAP